ncbi:MAG: hypothetical protein EOP64_00100 [Sphingomonas sp.]|nr:MAG: hypothetical protein EOP64_00100 [Sphingomonas sp.]
MTFNIATPFKRSRRLVQRHYPATLRGDEGDVLAAMIDMPDLRCLAHTPLKAMDGLDLVLIAYANTLAAKPLPTASSIFGHAHRSPQTVVYVATLCWECDEYGAVVPRSYYVERN